jgi:O-antigen ligase
VDKIILIAAVAIPFFMAIAPGPLNTFIAFLIVGFLLKRIIKKDGLCRLGSVGWPLAVFFLLTCLSIVHSCSYADSLKGGILRLLTYALVFCAIAHEIKEPRAINWILLSAGLGLALVSIDGIWQVVKGKDFIRGYEPVLNIGLARATASFKDANVFGVYLSALSPLLLGPARYVARGKVRLLLALAGILSLVGIALTYSRPTLLAIFIALLFLAIVKKDRLMLGALVFLIICSPLITPKSVKDWAREVEYNPLRMMCNDDRIAIYRNTLNMVKAHPFIGVGANTFMKNYRFYKESPEYRNVVTIDYIYAHNNFLHMAGELGLTGLAVFFWLLYALFKQGFSIYSRLKNDYLKVISLSAMASFAAFLVNGLTESSLYYSRVAPLFWYLAGLTLALKNFLPDEAQKDNRGT